MAAIVTIDHFREDIDLPKSNLSNLPGYIAKYEPIVLEYLLGYELYKKVIDPANAEISPIKEILDGAEYTVSYNGRDQLIKWPGLKTEALNGNSLIAYYVYTYYQKYNASSTQSVGEVVPKQENSYHANTFGKIMSAWSRFEELYGYSEQSIIIPSAYNYLKSIEDQIPEWIFTSLKGNINSHDL